MKITVLKSTVDTSLTLISKIITNAKPPSGTIPMLTIQSDKRNLWIGTTLPEQQFFITLDDAVYDDKKTAFSINFDVFRQSISALHGTRLTLEQEDDKLSIFCDEKKMVLLVAHTPTASTLFSIPSSTDSTILPVNFASFVLQAFSCSSTDQTRKALTGVNVSYRGVAGTDGRQLFYLPLPIQLKDSVTLPPSKNYNALKSLRWSILEHWKNGEAPRMFAILGENFKYVGKAIEQPYPSYWQAIPKDSDNDIVFSLTDDSSKQLLDFINDKEESFTDITVYPNRIEVEDVTVKELKKRKGTFFGKSASVKLPFDLHVNPVYLKQFLRMGFKTICTSSKGSSPLVSSQGMGTYLFMPCSAPPQQAAESVVQTASVASQPIKTNVSNTPSTTTTNKQEKPHMNESNATTNQAVRPTYQPTVTTPQPQANSLEETLASFTAMREQLANLESRLLDAGRRIKAALLEQRQKERIYQDATRKLERIRMAV